jgi:quinoprotein glucose dehydrogenase
MAAPSSRAGGLIFIAAATDNLIRAIDLNTGKTSGRTFCPRRPGDADGLRGRRQAICVIYAGGHHFMETPISDEVVVYALPS